MMHLLWNLTFFKMVPPKTNFFFSQTLGSTNQYSCQQFYGWGMTHLMPSYLKNAYVGEGPGETPSALSYPSYLINSFLTDIKQLAKTSKGDTVSAPFWCLCRHFVYFFYTLIKLYYTNSLSDQALPLAPDWILLLQRPRILVSFTAQQQPFNSTVCLKIHSNTRS